MSAGAQQGAFSLRWGHPRCALRPSWLAGGSVSAGGAAVLLFSFWRILMALSWIHRMLKIKSRPISRSGRKQSNPRRFVPTLEPLEDRALLSIFTPTSFTDRFDASAPPNQPISLRDAIIAS